MILNNIDNAMLGADQISKIYLGQYLIYSASSELSDPVALTDAQIQEDSNEN